MHLPPSTAELLPALRAATRQAHLRLESAVDIEKCLQDRSRYVALLQGFLGFYRPLEERFAAVGRFETPGYNLASRRKVPWLAADLAALGMSAPAIAALPDCSFFPAFPSAASFFGCLYVLEGATLGGRHITALMQASPVPAEARRFFAGYGAETGARWREFAAALEDAGGGGAMDIIDAAQGTFSAMERWINERLPRT